MTDPTPLDFSEAGTLRIARQACAVLGHADAELERLRLGENAIYRVVDAPLVVRIARSPQMLDDVRKEMRVARWLEQAGLPAARLAAETGDDALIVDGRYPVTCWQLIRSTAPVPDEADLRLAHSALIQDTPRWQARGPSNTGEVRPHPDRSRQPQPVPGRAGRTREWTPQELVRARSLLFMAVPRARDELAVIWHGRPSAFLPPEITEPAMAGR